MFVELSENYIEGLVHIASLQGDYYIFDEVQHQLIGKRSNKRYTIGQKLKVQLVRVDIEGGYIDFELAENEGGKSRSGSGEKSKNSMRGDRKKKGRLRRAKTTNSRKTVDGRDKNTAKKKIKKQQE